jgi:hypothetical protein
MRPLVKPEEIRDWLDASGTVIAALGSPGKLAIPFNGYFLLLVANLSVSA